LIVAVTVNSVCVTTCRQCPSWWIWQWKWRWSWN